VECRLGLCLLDYFLSQAAVPPTESIPSYSRNFTNLFELQTKLKLPCSEIMEHLKKYIKKEPYTITQIQEILKIPNIIDLINDIPNYKMVLENNEEYFIF